MVERLHHFWGGVRASGRGGGVDCEMVVRGSLTR